MLDRRGFLKFVGGAAVGTLATPVIWQGLDDLSIWTQNWPWIPSLEYGGHDNTYVRTVSKLCPSATGVRVRLVGGRPVRVLGDAEHPLSRGGISAVASCEVQLRHSPARLKRPMKRSPDGVLVSISWQEAEAILTRELGHATGKNGLLWLSGDENGSINELFSAFAKRRGSDNVFIMPGESQPTARAWQDLGGQGRVGYDFAGSDYVLALGANVLETWGPVVANRRVWGDARPQQGERTMTLAFAGPVQNNTAAGADVWLPIRPETELALALGLIHLLLKEGKAQPLPGLDGLAAVAKNWTPERVQAVTGLPAARLEATLAALLEAKAPLVIVGSGLDQGTSPAAITAGLALNALLGRLNVEGGVRALPVAPPAIDDSASYAELMRQDFLAHALAVAAGKKPGSRLLVFYEANPVYGLPGGAAGEAMKALFGKSAFSVSFTSFLDETANRCDLVIPTAFGLERFDDVCVPFGVGENVYALARPVVQPLYEARPAGEVLLRAAKALGCDLGFADMLAFYRAKFDKLNCPSGEWERLMAGEACTNRATLPVQGLFAGTAWQVSLAKAADRVNALAEKAVADKTLSVAVVVQSALGNAETAIPPFCTKTITAAQLANNVLAARMNAATAKRFGLYENTPVMLKSDAGEVRAVVRLYEGVMDNTVALTAGFGHTAFDVYNNGKGMNALDLFAAVIEPGTGCAVWTSPGVRAVNA